MSTKENEKIDEGLENVPKPHQKEEDKLETIDTKTDIDGSKKSAKRPADKDNTEPLETIDAKEAVDIDDSVEAKVVFEQETPDTKLSEDIANLLESIDLPVEFKEKAKTLFEAAVSGRIADIKKQMFALNEAKMEEYKAALATKLEEQVESKLTYAIGQWLEENQVAVKTNIRTQIAESFMAGLYSLFESHYIEVPEGKEDVLESTLAKLEELESKLSESEEKNAELSSELSESKKKVVLEGLTKNLTDTQAERVAELVESIQFDSVESYTNKVNTIVESITMVKPSEHLLEDVKGEVGVKEDVQVDENADDVVDPRIAAYASVISSLSN